MNTFYTRGGDDGTTGLLGKGRIPKHDIRIEAIGTLDEVSAAFGLARSSVKTEEIKSLIEEIQRQLYQVMGEVAATEDVAEKFHTINQDSVLWIEEKIDYFSTKTTIPKEFILPGDTYGGAALALTRTIVRRSERRVSQLISCGDLKNMEILRYLNRLSSLCFILELYENNAVSGMDQTLVK